MAKLKIIIEVNEDNASFRLERNNINRKDISLAVTQLELVKYKLLGDFSKNFEIKEK